MSRNLRTEQVNLAGITSWGSGGRKAPEAKGGCAIFPAFSKK